MTAAQTSELDTRQDELVGAHSPEGKPPEHWLRSAEWRWFRYVIMAVLLVAVIWIVARGVEGATVLMAVGLLFIMVFAAAPVWGAALLRRGEERAARAEALREIQVTSPGGRASASSGFLHPDGSDDIQVVRVMEEDSHA